MTDTFNHFGDTARLSNTDDGLILAADVNGKRIPASAWDLAKRLYAAGREGMSSADVSVTDRGILERAGVPLRSDRIGSRVYLDQEAVASKFVIHVRHDAANKHRGAGVRGEYSTPGFDRYRRWQSPR